jgi:plasmid maintenance system antidote protein VapI
MVKSAYKKVDFNQKFIRTAGIETPEGFDRNNSKEVKEVITQFLTKAKRSHDIVDHIKMKMYEKQYTAADLRKIFNVQKSHMSEMLAGLKPITPTIGVKLYKHLGIEPKEVMEYLIATGQEETKPRVRKPSKVPTKTIDKQVRGSIPVGYAKKTKEVKK